MNASPAHRAGNEFRCDTSDVEWADFFTPGTYYRIRNVDLKARTADMLVKFLPHSQCMYHRHVCCTTTIVLEGELRVREQIDGSEVIKVKQAGSYSRGGEQEVHIEGSGAEDAIIFFAMRTDADVIYELLNDDLSLRRAVTVEDFHTDWHKHWPQDRA
jgi:hypothetical protein